jgi:hypothetical protein
MWFQETVEIARRTRGRRLVRFAIPNVPRVSTAVRTRLVTAALLYGQQDVSSLGPFGHNLLDTVLFKSGLSQREWYGDFLPEDITPPFTRFNDFAFGSPLLGMSQSQEDFPRTPEPVLRAVSRVMRRMGITSSGSFGVQNPIPQMPVTRYVHRVLGENPWPPKLGFATPEKIALGAYYAINQSVHHSIPLIDSDLLAPAWIRKDPSAPEFEVIKAVIEVPDGPQLPRTLSAVQTLEGDPRLIDLRNFVDFAVNRILTGESDALTEVKREVSRIHRLARRGERAGRVAQLTTYVALPVGVAEVVLGAIGPGLAIGSLGFLTQGLQNFVLRRKRSHWLTL